MSDSMLIRKLWRSSFRSSLARRPCTVGRQGVMHSPNSLSNLFIFSFAWRCFLSNHLETLISFSWRFGLGPADFRLTSSPAWLEEISPDKNGVYR